MSSPYAGPARPRILFIDAYDSFSNNIVALLKTGLEEIVGIEVTVIQIDSEISDFPKFLKDFDAVVAGPGPGDPNNPQDVGLMRRLWSLQGVDLLPVLGICLGFQSLVLAFGGRVEPLPDPRHGIETYVDHNNDSIFYGLGEIKTVQYHSLHASLGHALPPKPVREYPENLFQRTTTCPELEPLAWDTTDTPRAVGYSRNPQFILMAVSHADWKKPFYGIQFHPESISSSEQAQQVVKTWWSLAKRWIQECSSNRERARELKENEALCATEEILRRILPPSPDLPILDRDFEPPFIRSDSTLRYRSKLIERRQRILTVPAICDLLGVYGGQCIVLDSEMQALQDAATNKEAANTGTHSIVGIIEHDTMRIEYRVGSSKVKIVQNGSAQFEDLVDYEGSIFTFLKDFMSRHKVHQDTSGFINVPFCGGLMGYITYEGCLETIGIHGHHGGSSAGSSPAHQRDICFAFVERSIVVDHQRKATYVQTIKARDYEWLGNTHRLLSQPDLPSPHCFELIQTYGVCGRPEQHREKVRILFNTPIQEPRRCGICADMLLQVVQYLSPGLRAGLPTKDAYLAKIRACQRVIRAGHSYELCLTTQATIGVPTSYQGVIPEPCEERAASRFGLSKWTTSPIEWSLYLRLRNLNPAPFSAYVRLGHLTLLSTSPERFMSWSRPHNDIDGGGKLGIVQECQFRPIKGTVKKSSQGRSKISLKDATRILNTPKERAENLMIVDLIRHDLHGVVGAGNVNVSELMVVEEYATVFQLVSVIEGNLSITLTPDKTAIDVLGASLPPGSMTGAPKLRSCQLLQDIEQKPRSVYSGVLGYMCCTGRGDFSVVIRSMYKWDADGGDGADEWNIGAGGAVTGLSTEEGEWEEMVTKLRSTLRLFEGSMKDEDEHWTGLMNGQSSPPPVDPSFPDDHNGGTYALADINKVGAAAQRHMHEGDLSDHVPDAPTALAAETLTDTDEALPLENRAAPHERE